MEIGINDCEQNYSVEYFLSTDCKDSTQGIEIKNGSTMVITPLSKKWIINSNNYMNEPKEEYYTNLINAINNETNINRIEIQVPPVTEHFFMLENFGFSTQKVYANLYSLFFKKLRYVKEVVYVPSCNEQSSEFRLFFDEEVSLRNRLIKTRDSDNNVYYGKEYYKELETLVLVSDDKKIFISTGDERIINKRLHNTNNYDTIFF